LLRASEVARQLASASEALSFVQEHGIVLASARGPAPRLTEAIVGGPIKGSWWAHPQGKRIYAVIACLSESEQILFCRLINRKITLIHCRLWPSLVRLAMYFSAEQLAQIREAHTASGRHITRTIPFPQWVPAEVLNEARAIGEQDAVRVLGSWLLRYGHGAAKA
jgi:hypothetical protein